MAEGKGVVVAGCVPQGDRGLVKRSRQGAASARRCLVHRRQAARAGRRGRRGLVTGRGLPRAGPGAPTVAGASQTTKRSSSRDRSFIHGVSGRVHLLQDAARGASSAPTRRRPSRPISNIGRGRREVWLSSEDTGAYGIDLQTSLSALLLRLIPVLGKRPFAILEGWNDEPALRPGSIGHAGGGHGAPADLRLFTRARAVR